MSQHDESVELTESELLRRSWDCCDAAALDTYLVHGVEDPRINVQSILTRSLLCDALFPGRYTRLIEEELRFGYVMTWLATQLEQGANKRSLMAAARGQRPGAAPDFVRDTVDRLQRSDCFIGDYVSAALLNEPGRSTLPSDALDTFQKIWHRELESPCCHRYSIFEPACGSANDFRCLASSGLARFVRYTGLDISCKNIANARRRFPDVDFRVGDLLKSGLPDDAFDFFFVHDLFEHLSPNALPRAIEELLRVTRREAWLHFFNAADMSAHQVRPAGSYHWNTLSIGRLVSLIERSASHVEVVSVADLAQTKFGFDSYYNRGAYTIIAKR